MNCGLDLMHPAVALDACLAMIGATPEWPKLLAYGVATVAIAGFIVLCALMLISAIWRKEG